MKIKRIIASVVLAVTLLVSGGLVVHQGWVSTAYADGDGGG